MRIEVQEFETEIGVRFLITASNTTEEALLAACVTSRKNTLIETGEKCYQFYLQLPVSNS